jgi:hypothetical protein
MKPHLLAVFLLAVACVPVDDTATTIGTGPQPGDLIGGPSGGGLVEREPDLCQAAQYQSYVGQPGTIVPSLGITRVYRVIEFGGIFSQEYNPGRINFWLSPTGEIARIGCG